MDGGASHLRRPDEGTLDAHRSDEAARRHRRAGALSGRRRSESPTPGPTTPSSRRPRPATRQACPSASALARRPTASTSIGAIFAAFGAILVDEKGKITVKSDTVRAALDYMKRLMAFLPPDAPSWDDASNNKMFVAGKTSLILNPPSAWAVAVRDAPEIAEQTWHHPMPKGPKGRCRRVPAAQPRHLVVRKEQECRQEPAAPSGDTRLRPRRWCRPARVTTFRPSQNSRTSHLGRDRPAEGHALSLPRSACRPDPGGRGHAEHRTASHRQIYYPGDL